MKDFYIFRSQFVPQTGTSPVTTHNIAFTKNALGLVVRRSLQPLPGTGAIAEYAELGEFRDARHDELSAEYAGAGSSRWTCRMASACCGTRLGCRLARRRILP